MKQTFEIPEGCKVVTVEQIGNQIITSFEPEKYEPEVGDCVRLGYGEGCYAYILIDKINGKTLSAVNVYIFGRKQITGVKFEDSNTVDHSSIEKITPEELQAEFDKLGYVYDFETHTASKKRWRANKGCEYYFFSNLLEVHIDNDAYAGLDNIRYNAGNYFETEEDAEAKINEIKNLLKP